MFFIVPEKTEQNDHTLDDVPQGLNLTSNKRKKPSPAVEAASYYPRRIPKACDRCRIKKSRCSGGQLCAKCKQDGVVCVTTTASKKGTLPQNPAYVHLVESQRDQLAQALHKILKSEETPASSKLRSTLAEMGIATDIFSLPRPLADPSDNTGAPISEQPEQRSWDEILSSLDGNQIQEIESFCASTPQMQGIFQPSQLEIDSSGFLPQPFESQPFPEVSNTMDYGDAFWNQDTMSHEGPWNWEAGDTGSGNVSNWSPDFTVEPSILNNNHSSNPT
jgi:hypothetical protein